MRAMCHVQIRGRATTMAAWTLVGLALISGGGQPYADTIRFKSGVSIKGVVVKETRTYVRFRADGSDVTVQYRRDDLEEIVRDKTGTEKAFQLFRVGNLHEALGMFQRAVKDDLSNQSLEMAWLGLSQVWVAKGQYEEAASRYVTLLRTDPNTRFYPYLPLPENKLANESWPVGFLNEALEDTREDPFVRHVASLLLAVGHISAGRFSEAEALLNAARRDSDRRVAQLATVVRAYGLYSEGKLDPALTLLEDAAWQHDMAMLPVLDYWIGRVAYERKDFRRAAAAMVCTLIMYEIPSPTMEANALLLAGRSFESLRQFDRALQIYDDLSTNFGELSQAREARERGAVIREEVGTDLTAAPTSHVQGMPEDKALLGDSGDTFTRFIRDLRQQGMDVIFVFDSTTSMADVITGVKRNIRRMIAVLREWIPECRLGVVVYRDKGAEYVTKRRELTTDHDAVLRFVSSIEVGIGTNAWGVEDWPEAVGQGLADAVHSDWGPRAHKSIIVVGDAPPPAEDLERTLQMAHKFRKSRQGVVHTIYVPTVSVEHMKTNAAEKADSEVTEAKALLYSRQIEHFFRGLARAGDGEALKLTKRDEVARFLLTLAFGVRWTSNIQKACDQAGIE